MRNPFPLTVAVLACVSCHGASDAPAPVVEGFVAGHDGVQLFYSLEGTGEDTVVVVHGGGSGASYLAPDLRRLSRGRALLYYDQRGLGRSEVVQEVAEGTLERHVADLESLRQHFGFERMTLMGHSWGGIVAGAYAGNYPGRIARMILVDPSVPAYYPFFAEVLAKIEEVRQSLEAWRIAGMDSLWATWEEAEDPVAICQEYHALALPTYFRSEEALVRSRGEFCGGSPEAVRSLPLFARHVFEAVYVDGWDLRPPLRAVSAPVLIVHGQDSFIGRETMEGWAGALSDARILSLPSAGHYLYVDRPDLFFPAVEQFLEGNWPEAAERTN
jgi:proline iminopeptidase